MSAVCSAWHRSASHTARSFLLAFASNNLDMPTYREQEWRGGADTSLTILAQTAARCAPFQDYIVQSLVWLRSKRRTAEAKLIDSANSSHWTLSGPRHSSVSSNNSEEHTATSFSIPSLLCRVVNFFFVFPPHLPAERMDRAAQQQRPKAHEPCPSGRPVRRPDTPGHLTYETTNRPHAKHSAGLGGAAERTARTRSHSSA